jgi:hypothetical protein
MAFALLGKQAFELWKQAGKKGSPDLSCYMLPCLTVLARPSRRCLPVWAWVQGTDTTGVTLCQQARARASRFPYSWLRCIFKFQFKFSLRQIGTLERVRTCGRSLAHHPRIKKQSTSASKSQLFVSYIFELFRERVDMVPVKREPDSNCTGAKGPSPDVWAASPDSFQWTMPGIPSQHALHGNSNHLQTSPMSHAAAAIVKQEEGATPTPSLVTVRVLSSPCPSCAWSIAGASIHALSLDCGRI